MSRDIIGGRYEMWTRRPGGQWHSQRDGTKDALYAAAKRIVEDSLNEVEILVAPLGYMPVRQDQGQFKTGLELPSSTSVSSAAT